MKLNTEITLDKLQKKAIGEEIAKINIRRAYILSDEALYQAKNTGRNKIIVL